MRPESPPYTTSDANQSIDAYQRSFWQRQIAKVEEQVSLPDEGINLVAEASGSNSDPVANIEADQINHKDLMDLFKPQAGQLPLARIKKVMKASDDQVKVRRKCVYVCVCTHLAQCQLGSP